ncbi:hypothetical protein [Nocardiopsis baichengensis]|uniref:hypothetical protein n=1 Tax=Nocardiopsis baichengensis TaxID=280240 RepID=UPI001872E5C9|nr:hypothetical protein [Nocardiopsis baichengensis]
MNEPGQSAFGDRTHSTRGSGSDAGRDQAALHRAEAPDAAADGKGLVEARTGGIAGTAEPVRAALGAPQIAGGHHEARGIAGLAAEFALHNDHQMGHLLSVRYAALAADRARSLTGDNIRRGRTEPATYF